MVKRATIHVSSRTKKRIIRKHGGIRGIKRNQQIQPIQDFTTKLPLQEKQVAILSSRSCSISWHSFSPWHNLSKLSSAHGLSKELFLVVYLAEGLYTRAACFVLAKRSISWHSFSPWHNLSKLSSAHGLSKELLLVVKVVLVVFPTQQAASKQHDTTLSIHLRCPSVPRMKQKTNSYE